MIRRALAAPTIAPAMLVSVLVLLVSACSAGSDQDTNNSTGDTITDPGDPQGLVPVDTGPGLDWERIDHPGFSLGYVVWSSTQFVTVNTRADGFTELLTSRDGRAWTDTGRTFEDIEVRDLAVSRDALAVWGTIRGSGDPDDTTTTIDRIHFSPDNGATWHQRDIRHPDASSEDSGSSIVTAAIRNNTVLVSAFFRDDDSSYLLRLDLDDGSTPAEARDTDFSPVTLDPTDTFIGDITVTASGIVMIGSDVDGSRIYTEGPNGWNQIDPDTRIATLLSDGRLLYANAWEDYQLLESADLGATWRPLDQDFRAFSQTFVGPSGVGGTNTISSTEPWATIDAGGRPNVGVQQLERGRPETYISWSADRRRWHHDTATATFGYPAFVYLAIGEGIVLAAATPLFGEPYEQGSVPTELYLATVD